MEEDQAAAAYTEYVNESERQAVSTTCNKKALFKVTKSTVSFCTMGLPGLYFGYGGKLLFQNLYPYPRSILWF